LSQLEKFVKKNQEHEIRLDFENKERRKLIPAAMGLLLLYIAWAYFTGPFDGEYDGSKLYGVVKLVWILTVLISSAVGGLFFIYSLAIISYTKRWADDVKTQVKRVRLTLISFSSLVIAFTCFKLTNWLSMLVVEHSSALGQFFRFGFSETPFLIELFLKILIFILAICFYAFFISLATLPLRAKHDARRFLEDLKTNLRE
jgi:hypothetical protein